MSIELVDAIKKNTENLFENASIMLQTCNLEYILCDLPIWKIETNKWPRVIGTSGKSGASTDGLFE